ncbi:MAG TPA: YoaK family protein [Thermoanaerobaculia bacterium]|nr:YoaK family protein [Thermoanaerobaculia bacterium]
MTGGVGGMGRAAPREKAKVVTADRLLRPLMVLTLTTGVIDAVSFVGLGHVFTANMTGNVVFIGFALAGAESVSVARSLVALVSFAGGALVGGRLVSGVAWNPVRHFAITAASEAVLLSIATVVAFNCAVPPPPAIAYALITLTAIAMGLRNAIVRKLGVPDVTTTVLTLTLTGLAADSSVAGGDNVRSGRRVLSVVAMLGGALLGTLLLRQWGFAPPLAVAAFLAGAVAVHAFFRRK